MFVALLKNIRIYLQGEDDGMKSKHIVVFDDPDIYGGSFSGSKVKGQAKVKPSPHR